MKLSSCQAIALAMTIVIALGCRSAQTAPAAPPGATDLPTSATANGQTIVAIAPPAQACCPPQTLPQKLGITGLFQGLGGIIDRIRNRLGSRFPGLEAKPPILSLTDPANAASPNPAVAAAAAAKADEDAAAQKVKAIRYLATLGCGGCYPDVEPALLAALDDCTELVRYEASLALRKSGGDPCKCCQKSACCSDKVRDKLNKVAYGMDDTGCYNEPSERVRRNARLALCYCGGPSSPLMQNDMLPQEGPTEEIPPKDPAAAMARASQRAPAASVPQSEVEQVAERIQRSVVTQNGANPNMAQQVSYQQAAAINQVRWEQLSIRLDEFRTRADAAGTINLIRTHILTSSGPLPREVMAKSLEVSRFDWTIPERLASPQLASQLSRLQVGMLSMVWEENGRLVMVRVLEKRQMPQSSGVQQVSHTEAASSPASGRVVNAQPASPAISPANEEISTSPDNTPTSTAQQPIAPAARAPVIFTTRVVPCNCDQR